MTQNELKVAGRIGAELGAAKAENDRLREVLSRIANLPMYQCSTENDYRLSAAKAMAVGALTHQADPTETTDTYTAVDMATAAAQGFRDGQAAVEPAQAQGERDAFEERWAIRGTDDEGNLGRKPLRSLVDPQRYRGDAVNGSWVWFQRGAAWQRTRPAQTAPQGKFRMGDLVKKSTGSEWDGRVVGWYSTEQTKEGYAVESSAHRNSVQIYPAKALEAVE